MSDRFNLPPNWQDMFGQFVREGQNWLGKIESSMNSTMPRPEQVEIEEEEEGLGGDTPPKARKHASTPYTGQRWEYKVAYVNFKGQISAEGEQLLIGRGERRSTFVRKFLDELGAEGWELSGVSPLGVSENSYFVFKRPATRAAEPVERKVEAKEEPTTEDDVL
jgi:hypothetical protein